MKSPVLIKEYNLNLNIDNTDLKELITTERFLYEDDIKRNPYLFETDEFIRQKFLEQRYTEYSAVDIKNDFVKQ